MDMTNSVTGAFLFKGVSLSKELWGGGALSAVQTWKGAL
jgi:hypothetical protein